MSNVRVTHQDIAMLRLLYAANHLSRRLRAMRHTAVIDVEGRRV